MTLRTSCVFAWVFTTQTSIRVMFTPEFGTGKLRMASSYWSKKYCDRK